MAAQRAPTIAGGLVLIACAWLAVIASAVLSPILPAMRDHFAAVPRVDLLIGLVATIPGLAVALLAVPFGAASDRVGARPVLLAGTAVYGAVGILPYWTDSLHAIIGLRALLGIAEAAVMIASTTLIGRLFSGRTRQRWIAAQVSSATLLGIAIALIGGTLGASGWRTPFLVYAFALLLAPLAFVFVPDAGTAPPPKRIETTAAPAAFGNPWLLALTTFASIGFYVVVLQTSFVIAERTGAGPATIGQSLAVGATGTALGSLAAAVFARIAVSTRLAAAFLLMGIGCAIMAVGTSMPIITLAAGLAGLGAGHTIPTLLGAVVADAPEARKGRVTGLWTGCYFVGQFLNPPLFLLLRLLGGLGPALAAFAAICLLIAAIYVRLSLAAPLHDRQATP